MSKFPKEITITKKTTKRGRATWNSVTQAVLNRGCFDLWFVKESRPNCHCFAAMFLAQSSIYTSPGVQSGERQVQTALSRQTWRPCLRCYVTGAISFVNRILRRWKVLQEVAVHSLCIMPTLLASLFQYYWIKFGTHSSHHVLQSSLSSHPRRERNMMTEKAEKCQQVLD